jgi:hypothetical protein
MRSILPTLLGTSWILKGVTVVEADAFCRKASVAFAGRESQGLVARKRLVATPRGGAVQNSDDESEDDESIEEQAEDTDDEEVENQTAIDAALAASAAKSAAKARARKVAQASSASKKAVNAKLFASAPKKKKSSGLTKTLHVPYLLRALMNPFTAFAMTRAFWASLFNLDYLKQEPSQELRSALEQKARQTGKGNGNRGKRKMKRGQAKTLSDLPQLNT